MSCRSTVTIGNKEVATAGPEAPSSEQAKAHKLSVPQYLIFSDQGS